MNWAILAVAHIAETGEIISRLGSVALRVSLRDFILDFSYRLPSFDQTVPRIGVETRYVDLELYDFSHLSSPSLAPSVSGG
ncbi:hypothetical protein D3C73_1553300 [compost metagenome]